MQIQLIYAETFSKTKWVFTGELVLAHSPLQGE